MGEKTLIKKRIGTRQLTIVGMLSAISVVLGLTGYGFIPLPFAKATIMHIPVIIGAIIEGPIVGVLIGLIFGIFSILQNIMAPNILSFALINPLVSVMPRILIGLTSYYTYNLFKSKKEGVRIMVATVIGSLTNTFGVLTMIYVLYAARYAHVRGISAAATAKAIYSIALINGIPEALIAVTISVPVILAVKKIKK